MYVIISDIIYTFANVKYLITWKLYLASITILSTVVQRIVGNIRNNPALKMTCRNLKAYTYVQHLGIIE